jgi:hypothetical protein
LFGVQAERRIGAKSNRTAAQGVHSDVVADAIGHEGNHRQPAVGDLPADEMHGQQVVERQARIAGESQQAGAQQCVRRYRMHLCHDVVPAILGERVVQPPDRESKQGQPE